MFLKISQLFYRIMQSESLQQQGVGVSDPEGPSSPVEDFPSCTKDVKPYLCGLNFTPSTHKPRWNFLLHPFSRVDAGLGSLCVKVRKSICLNNDGERHTSSLTAQDGRGQETPKETETASSLWPWDATSRTTTFVTIAQAMLDLPCETHQQLAAVVTVVLWCRHLSMWN